MPHTTSRGRHQPKLCVPHDSRRQPPVGPRSLLHGAMRDPWGTCVCPQCQAGLNRPKGKALCASPYLEDQTKRLMALQPRQRSTRVQLPSRAKPPIKSPYEATRGSLHVRAMRTLHDRMQVKRWLQILLAERHRCKTLESPAPLATRICSRLRDAPFMRAVPSHCSS
jgi:hypothetical protein